MKTITIALATFALAGASSAALATTYVAGAEFNGTQGGSSGVWQYGGLDGAGGAFYQIGYVGGLFTGARYLRVGADFMHPGCVAAPDGGSCVADKAFANLRFTAPTAGNYTATFQAKLIDPGNNPYIANFDFRRDGVRMLLNSDFKDLGTFDPNNQSFTFQTLTKTFFLAAGSTIDFSIDHNGARPCPQCDPQTRFDLYDSTAYTATVESAVPEPASWAMLIAGFGLIGTAMRRRRLAAAIA
jgi:hypothetical protein